VILNPVQHKKDTVESELKHPKIDNPNKSLSLPLETRKYRV